MRPHKRNRWLASASFPLLLAFPLLTACGEPKTPNDGAVAAPAQRTSTVRDREAVTITVYNGNFGLVREVRTVDTPPGEVALEFRDVAQHIQPETVHVKSLSPGNPLRVLEQNYRYDLLSPEKLLEKFVGRKIKLYRYNEKLGREEAFEADVIAVNDTPIFKVDGEITYGFPGRPAFSEVPQNLIAQPTLVWLLGSRAPKQRVEVTYMTGEMGWESDYVLTVDDEGDTKGELLGWVTLKNHSGASFEDAKLKLVAGDVQRVTRRQMPRGGFIEEDDEREADKPAFREEGFFEYHLYTLERPTTLLDNEQKQVKLLQASGVKLDKHLVFAGSDGYYRGPYGDIESSQPVSVFLEIQNAEANGLGMPLPKGTVRVYKADASGAKQFIGEDAIDHTPKDEKLRLKMGEAFDVVGDRKQTNYSQMGACMAETEWEISLRNHKSSQASVEVVEPVDGDWEIVSSSLPSKRKDARSFTFDVSIPPRGETKVTYRVRVSWC